MTTTELYSGYTAEGKPSSRVLRPPGGGSSNIFGGEDPTPQEQVRRDQQQQEQYQANQNANPPQQQSAPGRDNPTQDARQQYQKNKGRGEVPFARFDASGKSSVPSQFNNCDEESQKEADFRCYSVTAYRDAISQNAAVRERARGGQATGSFNLITHEEKSSPYQSNESVQRAPPQQQYQAPQQQPARAVRGQPHNANRVQYNPITGEEYPADYNQQGNEEEGSEEQGADNSTSNASSGTDAPASTEAPASTDPPANTDSPATTPDQPEASPAESPARTKPTTVKVRQPPGGKSSGPLW